MEDSLIHATPLHPTYVVMLIDDDENQTYSFGGTFPTYERAMDVALREHGEVWTVSSALDLHSQDDEDQDEAPPAAGIAPVRCHGCEARPDVDDIRARIVSTGDAFGDAHTAAQLWLSEHECETQPIQPVWRQGSDGLVSYL